MDLLTQYSKDILSGKRKPRIPKLKVTPIEELTQYSKDILSQARLPAITPAVKPVIQPEDTLSSFKKLYPDVFTDLTPERIPEATQTVKNIALTDTEAFLRDIRAKGRNQATENLLKGLLKDEINPDTGSIFSEEELVKEIDEILPPPTEIKIAGMYRKLSPDRDYYWVQEEQAWKPVNINKIGVNPYLQGMTPEQRKAYLKEVSPTERREQMIAEEATGVVKVATAPLFSIGGVNVSSSDIVGLAAMGVEGYKGVKSLVQVVKGLKDPALEKLLSTGLDKWIAERSRGVPPDKLKSVQNFLYDAIVKNKTWLQSQATESYIKGKGMKPNVSVVNEIIDNLETKIAGIIPRGTQTGAMKFGGEQFKGVPSGAVGGGKLVPQGVTPEPTAKSEITEYEKYITDLKSDMAKTTDIAEQEKIAKQIQYAETRIRDLSKVEVKSTAPAVETGAKVIPPTPIEIRNWRDMGFTPNDIAELKTMSPRLRELHTHQARITGFQNVSDEAITDYLQKTLALAKESGDKKAIRSIQDAIDYHEAGMLKDATLAAEGGLGYIHRVEMLEVREAQKTAEAALNYPKSIPKEGKIIPKPVTGMPEVAGEIPPVKPPEVPTAVADIPEPDKAVNIRLDKFSEDVRGDIKKWADEHPFEVEQARRGVRSDAQVRTDAYNLINEVGGDLQKVIKRWKAGTAWNAEELVAIRSLLQDRTKTVIERQKIAREHNSTENLLKLELALREQAAIQEQVHGLTAEAGRALRSFRQTTLDAIQAKDITRMEEILSKIGGRERTEKIAELLRQIDINDPIAVNKFIQSINKAGFNDYLTEIFYNSILSGPKTHIVNSISNTVNALFSPVERFVSALVDMPLSKIQGREQARYLTEVPADIFGAVKGIPEGFRQFAYVIKNGISLDSASKWEFRPKAFKGKTGAVINMPSRFLEGADQLMKAINQRAALNAVAHRIAKSEKFPGAAFDERVADLLSNPTLEMLEESNKVAEYRLFRQIPGKFGQTLMNLRESIDIKGFKPLRFLIPFIRTPMNLVKYGLERTPLGFVNPKLWENIGKKSPEAADQIARATIGAIGLATLAWYFAEGKITGAPPRDRAERDRFYREGKQPYAIRVGGFWVSYQRLEPFNQLLSQVAILSDMIRNGEKDILTKIADAANTFGQNFVSQTYMSSLSDLLNMLAEPERYAGSWLNRFVTAMVVPMSSATRTVAQMLDRTVRDPQNAWETIESNIPGLSNKVKAKLTALGEEVERKSPAWFPINVTPVEETILSQELERLKFDIGFAGTTITGMKLTDKEQRDYQTISGQLIKKDLEKLMVTPEYWQSSDIDKEKMIRKVVDTSREWAKTKIREQIWATGTNEERMKVLQTALSTSDKQLGNVVSKTPDFTHEPPEIYDTSKLDTSYRSLLKGVPEESLKGMDVPESVHSWYEKEKALESSKFLPNKTLISINATESKGSTYEDYYNQWQERSKITDEQKLVEFDKKYPDARLGNFSRRVLDLLKKYHYRGTDLGKQQFLDTLSDTDKKLLESNTYQNWIKSHPKENAQLALWGESKLLSFEAYKEMKKLVDSLDFVDTVLPEQTLPPDKSVEDYFKYQDMDNKNSIEASLLLSKDDDLVKFLEREPIDKDRIPIWELAVKYKKQDEEYLALSEGIARTDYLEKNEGYRKDRRRREAYERGFDKTLVEPYVEYNELPVTGYRRERFLTENPELAQAMEIKVPTKVPSVQYDDIYDNYKKDFDALETATPEEKKMMRYDENGDYTEFGLAELRRNAYKMFVPDELIEDYVGYKTTGKETPYEDDWFLMEHPDFYNRVYLGILGNQRKDYRKVPSREVYKKYLTYQQTTDKSAYLTANNDLYDWLVLTGKTTEKIKTSKSVSDKIQELKGLEIR